MGVVWEWGTHYWGSLEFPWTSKSDGKISPRLGGGFKYVLFSPLLGEDEPFFDEHIFQMGGSTTN